MTNSIHIAVISGSLRVDSFNSTLARFVANSVADEHTTFDEISLRELDLPLYNEDIEKTGLPESVLELKRRMIAADAMLIASPEYNGSVSGALKNAIDWASRPCEGESVLECFRGKVGGLMAASPGKLGGIRGLRHLRVVLSSIGVTVVPDEFGLGGAMEAFDKDGNVVSDANAKNATAVGIAVVKVARALKSM